MSSARVVALTVLSMVAFAANSLLCRVALRGTGIDAATFTSIRIMSGAFVLLLAVWVQRGRVPRAGNWPSALALFVYAAGFSFAYLSLPASTGALLLFAAVQATMIGYGVCTGERFSVLQWIGLVCALAGLVGLLLPGISAPPPGGAALMLAAGIAWGIYSLRGKGARNPTMETAGNFTRAVPFAGALSAITHMHAAFDWAGLAYAIASGAVTSGIGYVLWYATLPQLRVANAATVQLSVPVIAAIGATIFLGESLTPRIVLASVAILGGIAVVVLKGRRPANIERT
ncbi:DMT family transporter [Trinickia violacea]|uniref:DMT family transporter n=1 Tax=Trinickia violacea TaxID=2571746 RepID=A0A4P8IZF9_9BURK|nr:DMT family transporter [Trinickia violacea]QCP52973.1 DMT family transporter [Trinickia violacea]